MESELVRAHKLAESGDVDGAWAILNRILKDNPYNIKALVQASYVCRLQYRMPEAYWFGKAATIECPTLYAAWINLGWAAAELWRVEEALRCYRRATKFAKDDEQRKTANLNISAVLIDNGRYDEAEQHIRASLGAFPEDKGLRGNLGFIQLARRNWAEGWANYRYSLGSDYRRRVQYKDEPEWDGTPGKTVILYGEQGLGDEISFASMVPDAIRDCRKVIIDCEARLANLFRRSFPQAKVYGTRYAKEGKWEKDDWHFDASIAIGQIGEFYRTTEESFPGQPYLIPCPIRTRMWKDHFGSRPTIGVAWRGGIMRTNARNRQLDLEQLLPVFRSVPGARWVSLQYKDASKEIERFLAKHPDIELVQYPWATLTADYDDTAALIAALDHVVCIQTAVAHTAGALGTPVTVMVPEASQWRYGVSHDVIPWYASLHVVRQSKHGHWDAEISTVAERLHADFKRVSGAAAGAAPEKSGLRRRINEICTSGLGSDEPATGSALAGLRGRQVSLGERTQG